MTFADMNGNGVDDIVLIGHTFSYVDLSGGGVPPNLLMRVRNGLGATEAISYTPSAQLLDDDSLHTTRVPQSLAVVTQLQVTNNLYGPNFTNRVTRFQYRDPVYDGRARVFRGFRHVTATHLGMGAGSAAPGSITQTTYMIGDCPVDAAQPCLPGNVDNPYQAIRGLPTLIETLDEGGTIYQSTVHVGYEVRLLYRGDDGRNVRLVYPKQRDTYLYDTAGPYNGAGTGILAMGMPDLVATDSYDAHLYDVTSMQIGAAVPVRQEHGVVHLRTTRHLDDRGNPDETVDYGRLGDNGFSEGVSDLPVTTQTWFPMPAGGPGSWMWRPFKETVFGGTPDAPEPTSQFVQPRVRQLGWDVNGILIDVGGTLSGSVPLERHHEAGWAVAPEPPTRSVDGLVTQFHAIPDPYGNVIHVELPGKKCADAAYDPIFAHWPVRQSVRVGSATPGSCGPTEQVTFKTWDPGLGVSTSEIGADDQMSTFAYDGLGRLNEVHEPDPALPGMPAKIASRIYEYHLSPSEGLNRILQRSVTLETKLGSLTLGILHDRWEVSDALGQTLAGFEQAENTPGTGKWVVSGQTQTSMAGVVLRAYVPMFTSEEPTHFTGQQPTGQASEAYDHDAFGRVTRRVGLDGSVVAAAKYHALSEDAFDGEDLKTGGLHANTPATIERDGFGRTIRIITRGKDENGAMDESTTYAGYAATGELIQMVRSHTNGGRTFARTMHYDSLGRLVENIEPNSASGGEPSWIYAYDDAGQLVGTRDARGCGKNVFYDNSGRFVAEDFSPCLASQAPYSPADVASGDRTETFVRYDAPEPGQTLTPAQAAAATGRMTAVFDRGAHTRFAYDGRGRTVSVERQVAAPGAPADALVARYAPHWYQVTSSYDAGDRLRQQTTGADVAELLSNGASTVYINYSTRNFVSSVDSSYGSLVDRTAYDADGVPRETVFGDVAHTRVAYDYDGLRRLHTLDARRPAGPWVTLPSLPVPSPAEQLLPATGTEACNGYGEHQYDAILAQLATARIAAAAHLAAHPGAEAQSIIDAIDGVVTKLQDSANWLHDNQLDASNPSAASGGEWILADSEGPLQAAAKTAAAQAAATTSLDASHAFERLSEAMTAMDALAAQNGRCFLDKYDALPDSGWDWTQGRQPETAAAAPPPVPTSCHALDADALAPLDGYFNTTISEEQAEIAAYPNEYQVMFAQNDIDYARLELDAVATLRGSLQGTGLTAADPGTAAQIADTMQSIVNGVSHAALDSTYIGTDLPGRARWAYEADVTAVHYALELAVAAERCIVVSGVAGGGAPPSPDEPTFQSVLVNDTLTYDRAGNPINIADGRPASEWPAGAKPGDRGFVYDDDYRLTYVVQGAASNDAWVPPLRHEANPVPESTHTNRLFTQSFAYDFLGNRVASDDNEHSFYDRSLGTVTYDPAAPNRMTVAEGANGSLTATYDASGNLSTLVVHRRGACTGAGLCTQRYAYDWDETGRLARARRWDYDEAGAVRAEDPPAAPPSADLTYAYDSGNDRVLKTATDAGGNQRHEVQIFASLRLEGAAWDQSAGDYQRDAATEKVYLVAAGQTLARVVAADPDLPSPTAGTPHVFLEIGDHLGSTTAVIDRATSELVERDTYGAYGQEETDYAPARWKQFREPFRFTGKELDADVGLTYFGQRYYNAALGSWISPDPLAVHTLAADPNPYAYVSGGVLGNVDPYGLDGDSAISFGDNSTPNVDFPPPGTTTVNMSGGPQDSASWTPRSQQERRDPTAPTFAAFVTVFPDFRPGGTNFPLGHAGAVLIDNSDPAHPWTKYYEFGPYDDDPQGSIHGQTDYTPVDLGSPSSMLKLMNELSQKAGHNGAVQGVLVPATREQFAIMRAYGDAQQANHRSRPDYAAASNNCSHFARNLVDAGIGTDWKALVAVSPLGLPGFTPWLPIQDTMYYAARGYKVYYRHLGDLLSPGIQLMHRPFGP